MQLARRLKQPPRQTAESLFEAIPVSEWVKPEVAGSGFINFRVHPAAKQHTAKVILTQGERYGCTDGVGERRVMLEFVSANPTGPLHVGHGQSQVMDVAARNHGCLPLPAAHRRAVATVPGISIPAVAPITPGQPLCTLNRWPVR